MENAKRLSLKDAEYQRDLLAPHGPFEIVENPEEVVKQPVFYSVRFAKNDVYFLSLQKGQLTVVRELENATKWNKVQADGLRQQLEAEGWGKMESIPNPYVSGK